MNLGFSVMAILAHCIVPGGVVRVSYLVALK
jgi:hypothetical protein